MGKSLVVIGNGPSLRGFDFHSIECDSIGMNAAYRHWDQIGWYPTHYCCLDDELINTHHIEIRRLVEKGLVKSAFLSGRMLELHPEIAKDGRYTFLDQFIPYWHRVRGEKFALPLIEHAAFRTLQPNKITTGAYAVRFGAFLGYTDFAIIGVDLRYVEIIPEAEKGDGLKLTIKETPKHNPNYFFDGYQQAGDTYQVPNPASHNGLLHVQAFEALRDDFKLTLPDITIRNANRKSVLFDNSVFSFSDLADWMRPHRFERERRTLDTIKHDYIAIAAQPWSPQTRAAALECSRRLHQLRRGFLYGTTASNNREHAELTQAVSFLFLGDEIHADWDASWG